MITNNETVKLNKRTSSNETIGEVAYSCSSWSIFEKYWRKQNLPMSETRILEETQVMFLQLRLDSRLLPCSLYHRNEIREMEKEENEIFT